MNGRATSEGTENAVRVLRMVNSRRVHEVHEPTPFRRERPLRIEPCDDRASCMGRPDCAHLDCGDHPSNRVRDPKACAWFWRIYLGMVLLAILAAVASVHL